MKHKNRIFLFIMAVLCIGLLTSPVYAGGENQAESQAAVQQDNWEFLLALYVWMPKIEGTTKNGHDLEISFKDILENLDITLMTTFGARKNKWSFMTDVVYMHLDHSDSSNINKLLKLTDVYMKALVVNPFVSYEIIGNEKGSLQLLGGARYLWIESGLDLKTRPPWSLKKLMLPMTVMYWTVLSGSGDLLI